MRLRTKSREVALHVLYQVEITKKPLDEAFANYLENDPQCDEVRDFSKTLIFGVKENSAHIDEVIKKYVKNWEIDRMAIIDRNILRISVFELLFVDEVPPKVSINEAIELAKRFGDIDSPRFVNGVLDKIYKTENAAKGQENAPYGQ